MTKFKLAIVLRARQLPRWAPPAASPRQLCPQGQAHLSALAVDVPPAADALTLQEGLTFKSRGFLKLDRLPRKDWAWGHGA